VFAEDAGAAGRVFHQHAEPGAIEARKVLQRADAHRGKIVGTVP